jgi:hypothetical protein
MDPPPRMKDGLYRLSLPTHTALPFLATAALPLTPSLGFHLLQDWEYWLFALVGVLGAVLVCLLGMSVCVHIPRRGSAGVALKLLRCRILPPT